MRTKRLTNEERLRLREERNELNLIIERSRNICFNYIVVRVPQPKVCFMSGREREVMPVITKSPSPNTYYIPRTFIKNYPAREGYTPLATKTPRFPVSKSDDGPTFNTYNIEPTKIPKQCWKPFGFGEVPNYEPKFMPPSSGAYPPKNFGYKINLGFGTMRKIEPSVTVICTMINIAKCSTCGEQPLGDYRHNFKTRISMCSSCWLAAMQKTKSCNSNLIKAYQTKLALLNFSRVRHCEFYHAHNGTSAAVQHLPNDILKFKIQKEDYLASYDI